MTNGDKIRQMSNEELASVLPADSCTWCIASSFCENSNCNATQCDQLMLEWLKQEAEDVSDVQDIEGMGGVGCWQN